MCLCHLQCIAVHKCNFEHEGVKYSKNCHRKFNRNRASGIMVYADEGNCQGLENHIFTFVSLFIISLCCQIQVHKNVLPVVYPVFTVEESQSQNQPQ